MHYEDFFLSRTISHHSKEKKSNLTLSEAFDRIMTLLVTLLSHKYNLFSTRCTYITRFKAAEKRNQAADTDSLFYFYKKKDILYQLTEDKTVLYNDILES